MRGVLGLFEGVVTGAADGYGRMADRPAATLLHLGPGPRQRPRQPAQRPPGPHADGQHRRRPRHLPQAVRRAARVRHRDAWPATCRAGSARVEHADDVGRRRGRRGGRRHRPARPGRHADPARRRVVARGRRAGAARAAAGARRRSPTTWSTAVAKALRSGEPCALLLGGARLPRARACVAASRVADATGAKLLGETFPARLERGAGRAADRAARLPRRVRRDAARRRSRHLVLVDAKAPVSFFAYPDKAERPRARGLRGARARRPTATTPSARSTHLADVVGAAADGATLPAGAAGPSCRPAPLDRRGASPTRSARCCPRARSSSDEANTAGLWAPGATAGAPRHDWLTLTGGAIGQGLPAGHRRRRRLPRPQGRLPSRPTAARCTRCRRCGPRPARASTSPR